MRLSTMRSRVTRFPSTAAAGLVLLVLLGTAGPALAQSKNLAPGFTNLAKATKVVVMPIDIELFSISGGGILEPKADWTEAASKHLKVALLEKQRSFGLTTAELSDEDADDVAEVNALHAAVARSISMHHFGIASLQLPTKEGLLDWSLGEAVHPLKQKTGADYALFSWVRDSYASSERVATMIVMAAFGVGLVGGTQVGYASLVDLNTGQVLWFNRLLRGSGDLREADKAGETLEALLSGFPVGK